jgi:hypothetical protein
MNVTQPLPQKAAGLPSIQNSMVMVLLTHLLTKPAAKTVGSP